MRVLSFRLPAIIPVSERLLPARTRHFFRLEIERINFDQKMYPEIRVQESLEKKKAAIRKDGPSKLQVIADFDATLTRYWINGRRGQSSHSLLQQGNSEYDNKRQQLYEYYHPLEFSPTIPIEEKTKLMEEWWGKTHALLVEGGLTIDSIKKSVENAFIAFRDGVVELFEFLEERDVPVLIFSAGLADIIEEVPLIMIVPMKWEHCPERLKVWPRVIHQINESALHFTMRFVGVAPNLKSVELNMFQHDALVLRQKLHRSFKNVKIVSNRMAFDDNGRLLGFKGKTIHVLNKNEHALDMAAPLHDHIGSDGPNNDNSSMKKRTNVLLLGDHIGDLGMSDGLNYENRITVGFLNDNVEKSIGSYREAFDMVYLNDASMWGVVDLVSQLCSPTEGLL